MRAHTPFKGAKDAVDGSFEVPLGAEITTAMPEGYVDQVRRMNDKGKPVYLYF